ncbi:MAG: hypothetical protein HRT61_24065 [Ekhidna sp.]|nr:hypothetical protein [Ekhidna sp.]
MIRNSITFILLLLVLTSCKESIDPQLNSLDPLELESWIEPTREQAYSNNKIAEEIIYNIYHKPEGTDTFSTHIINYNELGRKEYETNNKPVPWEKFYVHNEKGRLISDLTVSYPGEKVIQEMFYTYDSLSCRLESTVKYYDTDTTNFERTIFNYEPLICTQTTIDQDSDTLSVIKLQVDTLNNRLTKMTFMWDLVKVINYYFDSNNRLILKETAGGISFKLEEVEKGKEEIFEIPANNQTSYTYEYDDFGNNIVESMYDENGDESNRLERDYNSSNLLTQERWDYSFAGDRVIEHVYSKRE